MEGTGLGLGEAVLIDGADPELVAAGLQVPAGSTDQRAMLNRIGHCLGLPSGPKPQTWLGLTSSGRPPPQLDRRGIDCARVAIGPFARRDRRRRCGRACPTRA